MLTRKARALLIGSALLAAPYACLAQSATPSNRLAQEFTAFAGSESNASALVNGLRSDTDVKLTDDSGKTLTFASPTGKMGFGNVRIALSLAEASLKQQGITDPTPAQIEAALNGGSVKTSSGKTVQLSGVLQMRSAGKGWGQIAQAFGFKLGDVMRNEHAERVAQNQRIEKAEKAERMERAARPDKPERLEKLERPEHPEHPEKPERPGR